jgi:hypothetical protein
MHLVCMHKAVSDFQPDVVLVDPITNLINVGTTPETTSMMTRLIDFLKMRGTTTFFTSLTTRGSDLEQTEVGISSLVDTWLLLQVMRCGGERNRTLTIIKSRGMAHSNQTSEYRLSDSGIEIVDTKRICEEHLKGQYRLEVIDLLKNPLLARGDQILAVPTLVRKLPEPMKKIIGNLSNEERVLVGLDVRPLGGKEA